MQPAKPTIIRAIASKDNIFFIVILLKDFEIYYALVQRNKRLIFITSIVLIQHQTADAELNQGLQSFKSFYCFS
jgi:hypothetical protein